MDHSLRSISYIADIGDLIVLMAKRRVFTEQDQDAKRNPQKLICHVFESEEVGLSGLIGKKSFENKCKISILRPSWLHNRLAKRSKWLTWNI